MGTDASHLFPGSGAFSEPLTLRNIVLRHKNNPNQIDLKNLKHFRSKAGWCKSDLALQAVIFDLYWIEVPGVSIHT